MMTILVKTYTGGLGIYYTIDNKWKKFFLYTYPCACVFNIMWKKYESEHTFQLEISSLASITYGNLIDGHFWKTDTD